MLQSVALLDIIPYQDLKKLLDALDDVVRGSSTVTDLDGNVLVGSAHVSSFCRLMRDNPATRECCLRSTEHLERTAAETRKHCSLECANLNLITACAPITVDGAHLANWKLGHFVKRRVPNYLVRSFAEKNGLPVRETLRAYLSIPLVSEKEFQKALRFLTLFTSILSETAGKNYLLNQADQEKERLLAILGTVMNNVDAVIYVNDLDTYRILYANTYLSKLLGRDILEGSLCYEVLQERDSPCPECPAKKLFTANGRPAKAPLHYEYHNPRFNRDFLVSDRLVKWYSGKYAHMQVAADITDRNKLAYAKASFDVEREFMARMSHELRTPLNGILGIAQLALQGERQPEIRDYFEKIHASGMLLLTIINDLLDYARIEAGRVSIDHLPFDFRETLGKCLRSVSSRAAEKGLRFSVDVARDTPRFVVGDAGRVSQVFMNLLDNAVKFTAAGGIRLHVRASSAKGRIRIDCQIADTGIGMNAEAQARIFEPFIQEDTTGTAHSGTGLGLSISKNLLKLMRGDISVASAPGEGSVFTFHFHVDPAPEDPAYLPQTADMAEKEPFRGRILVVEDNPINREILVGLLEETGFAADAAENGEEGVKAFLRREYDAVLMDIRMPVMDGLEAARRIRACGKYGAKSVPIIALTANAMEEDKEACHEAGMNEHLAKPIVVDALMGALARYLPEGGRQTM